MFSALYFLLQLSTDATNSQRTTADTERYISDLENSAQSDEAPETPNRYGLGDYFTTPVLEQPTDANSSSLEIHIQALTPGGAFERAGVKVGDVITEIGGETPRTSEDVIELLNHQQALGRSVTLLEVRRSRRSFYILLRFNP